jgi:hypothetical protein
MKEINKVLLFFAKPIYVTKINFDYNKVVSLIEKINFKPSGSNKQKYLNVENISEASEIKNILKNKTFYFLKKLIMIEFNKFKKEYLKYENNFKITTSWATKTLPNQTSNYHNHKNCMFSGVLYIQTDENSGAINFIKNSVIIGINMPLKKIPLPPGFDKNDTASQAEGRWIDGDNVRFQYGSPEKIGGWEQINSSILVGAARDIHSWFDLTGRRYVVIGTDKVLYILFDEVFYDITPLEQL